MNLTWRFALCAALKGPAHRWTYSKHHRVVAIINGFMPVLRPSQIIIPMRNNFHNHRRVSISPDFTLVIRWGQYMVVHESKPFVGVTLGRLCCVMTRRSLGCQPRWIFKPTKSYFSADQHMPPDSLSRYPSIVATQ